MAKDQSQKEHTKRNTASAAFDAITHDKKMEEKIFSYLSEKLKADNDKDVSLKRLFPDEFVREHSTRNSIEELFAEAGFTDQESFDAWTESAEAKQYITDNTDYYSWEDMGYEAGLEYLTRRVLLMAEGKWEPETFESDNLFERLRITLNIELV